jgi:hypothetical protein
VRNFSLFSELRVLFHGTYSLLPWQILGIVFLLFCAQIYTYAPVGEVGVVKVISNLKSLTKSQTVQTLGTIYSFIQKVRQKQKERRFQSE